MYKRQCVSMRPGATPQAGRQPLPGDSCEAPVKLLVRTPMAQADLATRHATPSPPVTAEGVGHVTGSRNYA